MSWYFDVRSDEYGDDAYGGYDTKQKAIEGMDRIKAVSKTLKDHAKRFYSEPYQKEG